MRSVRRSASPHEKAPPPPPVIMTFFLRRLGTGPRLRQPFQLQQLTLLLLIMFVPPMARASRPDASLCPLFEYIDDNEETVREFFECPGLEDPPNYRACCEEKCCPVVDSVLQVRAK